MPLREKFKTWMEEYADVIISRPFKAYDLVRSEIAEEIRSICSDDTRYDVKGHYGQGGWAKVPWIGIIDRRITSTAKEGVYIAYLLNKDKREIYLTLILGTENVKVKGGQKKKYTYLRTTASEIREKLNLDLPLDEEIDTGSRPEFAAACIYAKKYTIDLPDETQLTSDLRLFLNGYQMYHDNIFSPAAPSSEQIEPPNMPMETSIKQNIEHIKSYILSKGFHYSNGVIENLYLSLKSKPFTILAGISGTGKTRIVKLFAEAIGAEYKMVPVRPDWSDSSDLLGYTDLNGKFIHGAIFDFLHSAQQNPTTPHILCLDEMNLARVEYYLSDVLSVLETRVMQDGKITSQPLVAKNRYGADTEALEEYGEIPFSENLYIVGTVNMDETTFPFSKKVLDRANTIEFSEVDLVPSFLQSYTPVEPLKLENDFLRSEHLLLIDLQSQAEYVTMLCRQLQELNKILQKANAHVGYRVRDEIVFYMANNRAAGMLMTEDEALDHEIMQKILPRLQGSTNAIKEVLCELFKFCADDYNIFTGDSDSSRMSKVLNDVRTTCRFRRSAEKILLMTKRFEDDGFTTYWI